MNQAALALMPRRAAPLWRNVNFVLMWSSVAASGFGDRLIQLGAWNLLGIKLPGAQVSSIQAAVYFLFFLPYLLFGPLGGWLADTLPRKWIMLACDEVRGLLLLLAVLLVPAGAAAAIPPGHVWFTIGAIAVPSVVKLYAIILAVGALAAIFSPTRNATIPQIVPSHQLQSANAVVLGIAVIASMIGLIVGGRIIDNVSVKAGLIVGVALFMVSGTFFAFLRLRTHTRALPPRQPLGQIQRLIDGFGYIFRHRAVLQLVLLNVLFWGAANIFLAAIAALCKHRYGIPDAQLTRAIADMGGAVGLGMLASALWVAWQNTRRESAWLVQVGLLAAAVSMALLGLSNSYYFVGLPLAFITGFAGNTAMICVATLTQSLTPNYVRGRVFGARELLSTASAVVINLIVWRMPNADSVVVPALFATAGLMALVSLWGLWRELTGGPIDDRTLNVVWRFNRLFVLVWHRARWVGRHRVPAQGPVILAANHTAGLDPLLIQAAIPRTIRWIMLRKYRLRALGFLWRKLQPVAIEHGESQRTTLRAMLEVLERGEALGIFPEGGIDRSQQTLRPFAPGVGLLARKSQARIVPIWITGTPRAANLLCHFLKPSRTTVTFGQPYRPDPAWDNETIAEDLRQRIAALGATIN